LKIAAKPLQMETWSLLNDSP